MIAYILNLIDLILSLYAIQRGGVELNPLMQNPTVMILYKVIAMGFLLSWLSKRKERIAVLGMRLIIVVYLIIDLGHIFCILYTWRCCNA